MVQPLSDVTVVRPWHSGIAIVVDPVLTTPSQRLEIGDADGRLVLPTPGTGRTRIVVSAENVSVVGLDEVWIDLMPVAE